MPKTALLLICTGSHYWQYAQPLINSAKKFFVDHDTILWTDSDKNFEVAHQIKHDTEGFPRASLMRFQTFLKKRELLEKYDYLAYSDIDMLFVDHVGDIFSDGITATLHPGYLFQNPELEDNPKSTAYMESVHHYYCGGFQLGTSKEFLRVAEVLDKNIKIDLSNGIVAKWNDESHWNAYLEKHPPAKILSPSYCYPDSDNLGYYFGLWKGETFKPIIVALTKNKEQQQEQQPSRPCLHSLTKTDKTALLHARLKVI